MEGERLAGKVVIVTGAGRGIGREIALFAAKQGARVVVNDLGGESGGGGGDASVAQQVADEIVKAGGTAVANTYSISTERGAQSIVQDALDTFGRIDAVINNAGILRDRMFHNMTDEEWTSVIQVHLFGYFYVSRAAAPHFKAQGSGSYVHFTSPAALIGAIGQANYAAAKMGVVGLSTGIAFDMARYNVRSNCIAPSAWSRLLAAVPVRSEGEARRAAMFQEKMGPEKIAPLCAFLASDAAGSVSGQVFKVRGNEIFLMSQPRPIRSVHRDAGWTMESLEDTMLPAMSPSFFPLTSHLDVFSWDPI
ncbi:3-hydroxyacyl-CoA dehydrogenase [Bradyrhizobium sp. LTSPM299]|uniref:SDR family NAD(P)-dependent oxidoreductase n=1 Tax=Bradyrhizobium sp. LTSPM299 TaxID=1619233 RepID=UPI0005CB57FF|nr:SDR family NAD(P)-dependent oxidoreductase [Bradyrhizobium sp. LTSPM299]KJC60396.1 3-hydroxyacyl-CoA dehydrogenase [Bradyrhizobium sp. LTSPM299]